MIQDRERVKQLQQKFAALADLNRSTFDRVKRQKRQWLLDWNPEGQCSIHKTSKICEYDNQGRLIKLHLCGLFLGGIPPEVWEFQSLQVLGLWFNDINLLRSEVTYLRSLQALDLTNNDLAALPVEVCNLRSLQELYLGHNKLVELPAEIGDLQSLEVLSLYGNGLTKLPVEVGNLRS